MVSVYCHPWYVMKKTTAMTTVMKSRNVQVWRTSDMAIQYEFWVYYKWASLLLRNNMFCHFSYIRNNRYFTCSCFFTIDLLVCKTSTGIECELPFVYNGNSYDTCINVGNGGVPWCFTNVTKKHWEICNISTCPSTHGE